MHFFRQSISSCLLATFALTTFLSSNVEGHCDKAKCQTLYFDDFALPIKEDPLEPFSDLIGSSWFTPSALNQFVIYTTQSFARSQGVYTLFNKGIDQFPGALQLAGNLKSLTNNFAINKGETYRYKAEISGTLNVSNIPPEWVPLLYPGGLNIDIRPAQNGFIVGFFDTNQRSDAPPNINACFFFTSHAVWAYYDGSQLSNNFEAVGNRPFFGISTLVAEFDTSQKHIYEVEYHRSCTPERSYLKWIIDGKVVQTRRNLGFIPKIKNNELFQLAISNDISCGQEVQSTIDPNLSTVTIVAGQTGHITSAIFGSADQKGLAPLLFFPGKICFPTSFATANKGEMHIDGSVSIYHLQVQRCRK